MPPTRDPGCYYLGGLENYQPRWNRNDDGDKDPYTSRTAGRGEGLFNPTGYLGIGIFDDYRRRNDNNGRTRLKGDLPKYFEGNWGKTIDFLITFKRFIIMNRDSAIARDPYKKCAYFMGCIQGQKTQGWVQRNYDWLGRVETDKEELLGRSP